MNLSRISVGALLALALALLTGCGVSRSVTLFTTQVEPVPGEDLAGPCTYDLLIPPGAPQQQGVLVIYQRADSQVLFDDADVQQLAASLNLGLLFAHQCNARSFADLQPNAARGPGRALFTALTQLAVASAHPEIASANVLLYGFSAGGVLAGTTAKYRPQRVLAVIAYAAASSDLQISAVPVDAAMARIPFLLLSNAEDVDAGTANDQAFFNQGRNLGAPWAYAVQKGVGHCCNRTTKPLILPWLSAIAAPAAQTAAQTAAEAPAATSPTGTTVTFECTPNGIQDVFGVENCDFTYASLGSSPAATAPRTFIQSYRGWLPDQPTADAWLAWVTH